MIPTSPGPSAPQTSQPGNRRSRKNHRSSSGVCNSGSHGNACWKAVRRTIAAASMSASSNLRSVGDRTISIIRAQLQSGDAGGDVEALLRLHAERLEDDVLVGAADERVGADAETHGGLGADAAVGAVERARWQAGGRREHGP